MTKQQSGNGSGLVPTDDAIARLLAGCPAPPAAETTALAAALGRTLAAPVTAPIDVPGHDNSAVDGYAVRVADGRELPVSRVVAAGDAPAALAPGSAARIFTGAPVPAGADAIVMQEDCQVHDDCIVLPQAIDQHNNIRRRGESVQAGTTIINSGTRLRAQELGLAAAVGVQTVQTRRRLRVAVLTTGDELARPGQPLAQGQIYDSNGLMLASLLTSMGYECLPPVYLPDDFAATRAALAQAAERADVVVTAGGVSVGDRDHVKPALQALGRLDFWRVAIKPGKPFAFGWLGQTPFMGLPGNPVSVFVTLLILVRPFLARLQGRADVAAATYNLPAGFDHAKPAPIRREYLRAQLRDGRVQVHPQQGSGVLSSTVWADGLVCIEPGQDIHAGAMVPYLPFAQLLT